MTHDPTKAQPCPAAGLQHGQAPDRLQQWCLPLEDTYHCGFQGPACGMLPSTLLLAMSPLPSSRGIVSCRDAPRRLIRGVPFILGRRSGTSIGARCQWIVIPPSPSPTSGALY